MIGKKELFAYGLSQLSTGLATQAVNLYIYFFYSDVVGLSLSLLTLGMTIYGAWNMINDPLAGFISDRLKTRWGRRRPLIIFFTPMLVLAFILIWTPPVPVGSAPFDIWNGLPHSQFVTFVYFTFFASLFDTGFTFVGLALASLFPEMSEKDEDRVRLQIMGLIFGGIGMATGMLSFSSDIIKKYGIYRYQLAILFSPIIVIGLYAMVASYKEKEEFVREEPLPVIKAFTETMKNKAFITYVVYNLMLQYINVLVMSMLPFVAKYVTHSDEYSLLLTIGGGLGIGMGFWYLQVEKLMPRKTAMAGLLVGSIGSVFFLLADGFIPLLIAAFIIGFGLGASLLLSNILIANAIDYDELVTGVRREGIYFGYNAFIIRFSVIMGALTAGPILGWYGYVSGAPSQPASVALGVRVIVGVFPLIAMLIGFVALYFYPLDGQKLIDLKEKIEELHAEKRRKLKQNIITD